MAVALAGRAQAVPQTHFVLNATGGFDGFIYPETLNGTPSVIGGIFTLPQVVNPGWVVILATPTSKTKDTSSWFDVIHFFDSGTGVVNSIQMFMGGPNQASYYPTFNTVNNDPHAFIIRAQTTGPSGTMFTTFTDYSVMAQVTRNYHFFTGLAAVPEGSSTLILLGFALTTLFVLRRKLLPA